jgi:predicted ATPase/Tfp pilus assembly protein PilF
MPADPDEMDDLVDSVSEGKLIDWAEVGAERMDETSQLLLGALKDVARIAEFNRERQRSAPESPGGTRGRASGPVLFRWGHLEALELVGRGSFGEVYRAIDTRLQREVALKLRRGETRVGDRRFLTEARDLAKIRHPNVVVVYGADTHDGQIGFWTDFVHGQTLAHRLAELGPLTETAAIQIGIELCRAMQAVHGAGLVHGDVKIANVMIDEHDRVVLMDFGAARPRGEEAIGGTVCSPLTTAPEILDGEAPRPTADLYSLGTLLFQLVTGRTPFDAGTMAELDVQLKQGRRAFLTELRADLSQEFVAVVERALSLDPDQRYQSAEEMAAAFNDALAEPLKKAYSLPAEPDLLIGRDHDLTELEQKLAHDTRLITLLGPAGTGKTRLAVRAGWNSLATWPGGVWFCDLSEARDRDRILSVVAGVLNVPLAKSDPVEQLGRAIAARRRCLMVFDNFEQVAEFAEATVGRWLEMAPAAHFLTTSRERLRVRGETVHVVEPLPVAAAVDLFVERARQQAPDCVLDGPEAEAVRELVSMVDGLPLAIELAAARITVMSPAEILGRMRDRFRVLSRAGGGAAAKSGRHSTLEAAIDGSWELLQPWEKVAFAQCAVFQGGFTLEAAENVLDLSHWPDAPWAVDVVQSLVDKSLLRVGTPASSRSSAAAAEARIGMYASLQEYARQKLQRLAADGTAVANAEIRHGAWYARYGTRDAIAALDRRGGIGRARRLELEFDNLLAACRRALARKDGATAARTWEAAEYLLHHRGRTEVTLSLAAEVAAVATGVDRFFALLSISYFERVAGQVDKARGALEEALAIARAAEDSRLIGVGLHARGSLSQHQGRMDESQSDFKAAVAVSSVAEDPVLALMLESGIGVNHLLRGEMAAAIEHMGRAVQISRQHGARSREGNALGNLAIVAAEQGRTEEAREMYEAALAIHRETGHRFDEANNLGNIANLLSDQGRLAEARDHYAEALGIAREIGDRRTEGIVLGNLGTVESEEGRIEEAAAHIETALAIARELKSRRSEGYALGFLAELERGKKQWSTARAHFDLALDIARELQNKRLEGVTLTGMAGLLGDESRFEEARTASTQAQALLEEVGDRSSLGNVMCGRAEIEAQAGNLPAATSALETAEVLADEVGAAAGSLLRRRLTQLRTTLLSAQAS